MEMGAKALRGTLSVEPEGIVIDETNLTEWLAQHNGAELLLIVAPVGRSRVESLIKTCNRCGRDYTEDRCPYCAEARARLRG
jgi:hypothetical protein